MSDGEPASSVQEVPKVTAQGPDGPSSVQASYGRAVTFYATTVASPTLHPYMWRSQDTIPYAIPLQYPALSPPGGIFAHPTVSLESAAAEDRNVHQTLEDEVGEQISKAMNPGDPVDNISAAGSNPSDSVAPGVVAGQDNFESRSEKRKQSNRESARRSRLRKQYEYEELHERFNALNNENHFLKKELQKLVEDCNKITSENDSIKAKLLKSCGPEELSRLLESALQKGGGKADG